MHSGILASAAALHHDLEEHGILAALFTGAAVDSAAGEAFKAGNNTTKDFPQDPSKETSPSGSGKSEGQGETHTSCTPDPDQHTPHQTSVLLLSSSEDLPA